jgi:predicted ATP-grasp superfamily ATP-dependent carboligase
VESCECAEIEEHSELFLREINFYGLVELEFKLDPRDHKFKLLDVNARAWGFHGIGPAAGIDFPYLLYADQIGHSVEPKRGKAGVGWLRLVTDVPTAFVQMGSGHLGFGTYMRSLRHTKVESVYSSEDRLPLFAEFALLPYLFTKKMIRQRKK